MKKNDLPSKAVLFKEDLKFFLRNWEDSSNNEFLWWKSGIDDAQKKKWPLSSRLIQTQLGNEDEEGRLHLQVAHPETGEWESVGTGTKSTARKYFEDNESLRWMHDGDIVRAGLFFHWGYYRTLNMLLKVEWEKYFKANAWGVMKYDQGSGLCDMMRNCTKAFEELGLTFCDDVCSEERVSSWYAVLDYYGFKNFEKEKFPVLVKDYCVNHLYLYSVNDQFWELFSGEKDEELSLASDDYWDLKALWASNENRLEAVLYDYGQEMIRYKRITQRWYHFFGEVFHETRRVVFINQMLQDRILMKTEHPEMDSEEIIAMEKDDIDKINGELGKLGELKRKGKIFSDKVLPVADQEEAVKFHQSCKKILKRIWRMTHPDKFDQEGFTEKQVAFLAEKFQHAMEINERILAEGAEQFDMLELMNLEAEVKHIWQAIGKVIPEYDRVLGETFEEKMEWLRTRIAFLEEQIKSFEIQINMLEEDDDYLEKMESLNSEESIKYTKRAIEDKLEESKRLQETLVRQCEALKISADVKLSM